MARAKAFQCVPGLLWAGQDGHLGWGGESIWEGGSKSSPGSGGRGDPVGL